MSLGAIPQVLNSLKEEGYIAEREGKRRLLYKEKLFEKWVEHYPSRLRCKLKYDQCAAPSGDWWKNFPIDSCKGVWGGETGAAILHSYLIPEIHTAYLPSKCKIKFFKETRLSPIRGAISHDRHVIEMIEPFWPHDGAQKLAPLLVIYADLIQTGDARNIESAKMIYEEYLVGYFEKD